MTSGSKKAKLLLQEDPTGAQISEPGSEGAFISQLPPEVIAHILAVSGNFKLIKTFRLVSKYCNCISSAILKKLSRVSVDEAEDDSLDKLKQLLIDRQFSFPSEDWPNAFETYKVAIGPRFSKSSVRLIQSPAIKVQALAMTLVGGLTDLRDVETVLSSSRPSLELLSITVSRRDLVGLTSWPCFELAKSWISLTTFVLGSSSESAPLSDKALKFIKGLITHTPNLHTLSLETGLDGIEQLLALDRPQENWRHLTVQVTSFPLSLSFIADASKSVSKLEAPNLNYFKFHHIKEKGGHSSGVSLVDSFLAPDRLVARAAATLETVSMETYPLSQLPFLPKLKTCEGMLLEGDRVRAIITMDKFPELRTLRLSFTSALISALCEEMNPMSTEPHTKLRALSVTTIGALPELDAALLWTTLATHFPGLKDLSVSHSRAFYETGTDESLAVIWKWFPNIRSLYFNPATAKTPRTFESISDGALPYGTGLKSLELGDRVVVNELFFRTLLPQMKGLESCGFYWHDSLRSVEALEWIPSLMSLPEVVINYKDPRKKKKLVKFAESTPNVTICFKT